jgi:hypothetical protein
MESWSRMRFDCSKLHLAVERLRQRNVPSSAGDRTSNANWWPRWGGRLCGPCPAAWRRRSNQEVRTAPPFPEPYDPISRKVASFAGSNDGRVGGGAIRRLRTRRAWPTHWPATTSRFTGSLSKLPSLGSCLIWNGIPSESLVISRTADLAMNPLPPSPSAFPRSRAVSFQFGLVPGP